MASGRAEPSDADLEALRYAETAILRTRQPAGLTVLLRIDVGPVRTCYAEDLHDFGGPPARRAIRRRFAACPPALDAEPDWRSI